MNHPFLDPRFEIEWSKLTASSVQPDIEQALRDAQARVDAVAAQDLAGASYESAVLALEEATEALSIAWSKVNTLDSVCNAPELRAGINAMLPKVSAFFSRIPLHEGLWRVIRAAADKPETQAMEPLYKRHVNEAVLDFMEAGADLSADKKRRLEAIQGELSQLTQKFSENTLDSTNAFELVIDDESRLQGLPPHAREAARQSALKKGYGTAEAPQWRFTLHAPSLSPAMQYLDDADIRRQLYEASSTVGRKDPWDNTALIWRILELRQEKAQLLGYECFADLATARRMAKSGRSALAFVEDLHARIREPFAAEVRELEAFKAEHRGAPQERLEPWDLAYWNEKLRRSRYDFDDEELRPYFAIGNVIDGLFRLAERLFGLRITERKGEARPDVWHPDVRFYEMHDAADGRHLGSFYADWHPRESKRSGAWMNYVITGKPAKDGPRGPHLGMICGNLTEPQGDTPALLTHREVETVFHEFGHLLHHLLGDVPVKALNGIAVAWDFVELPSQIMENWTWERASLDLFARHYQTGKPIPSELFDKMMAARQFSAARVIMRQLAFGKMDLELHVNYERYKGRELDAVVREVQQGYIVPTRTPAHAYIRGFGHLFSSPMGYAAGYYSYKWAEVLEADAFTRFKNEGILNEQTGREFRDRLLSQGNSQEPGELFRAFMGREPDPEALLVRCGLA